MTQQDHCRAGGVEEAFTKRCMGFLKIGKTCLERNYSTQYMERKLALKVKNECIFLDPVEHSDQDIHFI